MNENQGRATANAADPEFMARSLIEEYAHLGMSVEKIISLFHDPCYGSAYDLCQSMGEEKTDRLIRNVLKENGTS